MKTIKNNKTTLALFLSITFSTASFAAEQDVVSDIPVAPMNTQRLAVEAPPAGGAISNAVDQAIIDAVSKSMPAESVQALKNMQNPNVDVYGRPINPNAPGQNPALMNGLPQVKTENTAAPLNLPNSSAVTRGQPQLAASPVRQVKPEIAGTDPVIDKVRKKYKPHQIVKLKPGNGELIPVATGLQNRISTPFHEVEVKTSDSELPIAVEDGGFIYVTPMSQAPIGLMVGEKGMPETMVSLTLMPLDVPPVMVDVKVSLTRKQKAAHKAFVAEKKATADKEEYLAEARKGPTVQNDPRINPKHEERATSVLAAVANGELPQGFDMLDSIPAEDRYPCDITRMTMYHEVGQRLVSGREIIDVVLVKNDINGFREIREEYCLADDVIAVGVFDRATLAPGESSELYILRDKLHAEKQKRVRTRPRLTSSY